MSSSHVIFDAQIRPSFIKEACELQSVNYDVILFDCTDAERKKRLIFRGHPELADDNMMHWAAFLRSECQKYRYKTIDNSYMSVQQTFKAFDEWLRSQLSE